MEDENLAAAPETVETPAELNTEIEATVEPTEEVNQEPEVQEEQSPVEETVDKKNYGYRKRIDKLTFQREQAKRENQDLRQRLEALEARQTQEPTLNRDAYTDDEWLELQVQKQVDSRLQKQQEDQNFRSTQAAAAQEANEAWQTRINEYDEEMPDYAEVLQDADSMGLQIPVDVIREIRESPQGPRMAYHLAQNPNEATKLQSMSPMGQARYLMRLENQMEAKGAPIKKAPLSQAQVTPKAKGRASTQVDEDKLSMKEWMARRNKQVHGR